MKNSLRKRIKKTLENNNLISIEIIFHKKIPYSIIAKYYITEEFYRLKYDSNYVFLTYNASEKNSSWKSYFYDTTTVQDDELMLPIIKALTFNTRTYKTPSYIYMKLRT